MWGGVRLGGCVCVCGGGMRGGRIWGEEEKGAEGGEERKESSLKQSCIFSYVKVDVWSMVQLEQSLNNHNIK